MIRALTAHRPSPWLIAGSLIGGGTALIAALYVSRKRHEAYVESEAGGRTGEEPDEVQRVLVIEPIAPAPPAPAERSAYTDADREALAWALHSEGASHSDAERKGIAFVIRNYARRVKRPIASIAPPGTEQGGKQPWSTARAPNAKDRADAARFLAAPWGEDPVRGAHKFFEPQQQDDIYALAEKYRADPKANAKWAKFNKYKSNANDIRRRWTNEGGRMLASIGRWEFWGRASAPTVAGMGKSALGVAILGAARR